jgi:hypothetical protein
MLVYLFIPGQHFLGEYFQFNQQNSGLQGIQTAIEADADILVFIAALAVDADRTRHFGQFIIVRKDRTAVAIASQRFGRKERSGRAWRQRSGPLPLVGASAQ